MDAEELCIYIRDQLREPIVDVQVGHLCNEMIAQTDDGSSFTIIVEEA